MTTNDIALKMTVFEDLHRASMNTHYMLLCKEYNYYTIFECDSMLNMPTFGAAVSEIISNIGEVYSIEPTENEDAVEIWIKPEGKESSMAFYLFPYDAGVVYYG